MGMIDVSKIKDRITVFDYFYSSSKFKYEGKKGIEHYFLVGDEKNASLSVNAIKNIWFHHGFSIGGDVIKAVEFWEKIEEFKNQVDFLLNMGIINYQIECTDDTQGIKIKNVFDIITNKNLLEYAQKRGVSVDCVDLKEIHFETNGKKYYALGFKNRVGGYDVRNAFFKGKIGKTDISIGCFGDSLKTLVFEGFTDLLAYRKNNNIDFQYIVLNSTANVQKAIDFLQQEQNKYYLLLDNDHAGNQATQKILKKIKAIDMRKNYDDSKDVCEHYLKKRDR